MSETLTTQQRRWLDHLQQCHAQGLSYRIYAQHHGLKSKTLYNYKALLQRKGFLGEIPTATRNTTPRFQRISLPPGRSQCHISLPNGVTLSLDAGSEPLWLAALVKALIGCARHMSYRLSSSACNLATFVKASMVSPHS
jgi:hypothetical protein